MKAIVRVLSLLLAAICVLSWGGGALAQEGRVEGTGYPTPEEALLAYADALKAGDIDGMLSTFCVETYCERFDTEAYLEELGIVNPVMPIYVSANGDPFLERLNRETRQDEIVDNIVRQFRTVALLGTEFQELNTGLILKADEVDPGELLALLGDSAPLSSMSVEELVPMEDLIGRSMEDEIIAKNVVRRLSWYGADEMACTALRVQIRGESWLLTMDAVRYGDRWYNVNSMGMIAAILGFSTSTGGLAPESAVY